MKKFRFFSLLIAAAMLVSTVVSADFSDMPADSETKTAIENAVANGILSGFEDGTVRPDENITRAQMASIISRACGADKEADISEFTDVPAGSWYFSAFAKAYSMGAFSGDDNKLMHPENNITFQECFTILSQVFDLLPPYTVMREIPTDIPENTVLVASRLYDVSNLGGFSDGSSVADWAKIFVSGVVANGGWNGENGLLTPTAYITRGQFARVMNNLISNYIDSPGTYTSFPGGNTIIRTSDVVLDGLKTDSDIFVADNVAPNSLTVNNVTAKRIVVRGCATPLGEDGKPINEDWGLVISGQFGAIRIIRPYISADISSAKYEGLYSAPNTNVNLGIIMN